MGRPKGALNKVTRERMDVIEKLRVELFDDADYLERVVRRIKSGSAPTALELMIWDRVLGKVKEQVRVEHTFDPQQAKETMREKIQRLIAKVEQS